MTDIPMDEVVASLFVWTIIASWRALPLLIIALTVNFAFRRTLAARFHCILWLIVAARLMLPFSMESTWSMQGQLETMLSGIGFKNSSAQSADLHPYTMESESAVFHTADHNVLLPRVAYRVPQGEAQDARVAPAKMAPAKAHSYAEAAPSAFNAGSTQDEPQDAWTPSSPASMVAAPVDPIEVMALLVGAIWSLGIAILSLRGVVRWLRMVYRIRSATEVTEQPIIDQLLRVCDKIGRVRRPVLKEVSFLSVPAVFGWFRPTICLPQGTVGRLESDELRLILQHEVAHIKRRDSLFLVLVSLARTLHWYNPLAWLVASRARVFMEQAADQLALKSEISSNRVAYGHLLVSYASANPAHAQPALGLLFSSPSRQLRRRINALDARSNCGWAGSIIGTIGVTAIALVGLTDARPPLPAQDPPAEVSFSSGTFKMLPQTKSGEEYEETYDIEQALQKISETPSDEDPATRLKYQFMPHVVSIEGNQMILKGDKEQHLQTASRLAAIADSGCYQISFDVRIAHVRLERLTELNIDWKKKAVVASESTEQPALEFFSQMGGTDKDELQISIKENAAPLRPVFGVQVNRETTKRFLSRSSSDVASTILQTPKVTLFNGQLGMIQDETQRPFVTGVTPIVEGSQFAIQPIVQVFSEGTRLQLKGHVTADDQLIIQCALRLSDVDDVGMANLPYRESPQSDQLVTIQVPKATSIVAGISGRLRRDESLLIACPLTFTKSQPIQKSSVFCFVISPDWFVDPE